jgi:hypothetical protein
MDRFLCWPLYSNVRINSIRRGRSDQLHWENGVRLTQDTDDLVSSESHDSRTDDRDRGICLCVALLAAILPALAMPESLLDGVL